MRFGFERVQLPQIKLYTLFQINCSKIVSPEVLEGFKKKNSKNKEHFSFKILKMFRATTPK